MKWNLMMALFIVQFVVTVFVFAEAEFVKDVAKGTDDIVAQIRLDYVQLGLWLAVGNAIGVPIGSALVELIKKIFQNDTAKNQK